VPEAVFYRKSHVHVTLRPVPGLEKEVCEVHAFEPPWVDPILGIDEFQFVAARENEIGFSLGADAYPVDSRRGISRPVRFDRRLESTLPQHLEEWPIDLQQRLAAGQDQEPADRRIAVRPGIGQSLRKSFRVVIASTARTVSADNVGVAERAA
jgi:hypothetical protein